MKYTVHNLRPHKDGFYYEIHGKYVIQCIDRTAKTIEEARERAHRLAEKMK